MAAFRWSAINGGGDVVRGVMEAPARAGEAGGSLPATLDRLASLLERERSLIANLRSALIYPALLIIAAIGSIVLLLEYVLPQFTPIFEQAGAQLPPSTRILMAFGTA